MEPFDIGLDGEEIEVLPDFDDLPAEPPKKRFTGKNQQQKTKGLVDKKFKVYPWMNSHHFAHTRLEPS